jgi:uncharacterized Ntn-hydrolase superfamily protein
MPRSRFVLAPIVSVSLAALLPISACRGDDRPPVQPPPASPAQPQPQPQPTAPASPASAQPSGSAAAPVAGASAAAQGQPAQGAGYCRRAGTYTAVPLSGMTGSSLRPANTFSIVARDPATGELGVAVQSHWFSVGSSVTWAEPGIGAVATQSFVEPAYGPKGLALMRVGAAAPDALKQLLTADASSAVRQVAFVDAQGRVGAHTGARCIAYAGHHVGDGYSVQANMMGNDKVVPAMRQAFEATRGDLAERMLAALDAAQAAGGDIRGCQSAAMLVVDGKRTDEPWKARKIDLRVEDSPAPLAELRRLVTLARAYDHMNQGDLAIERDQVDRALEHYGAAARMVPGNAEMLYWQGISLAGKGRHDEAMPVLRKAFEADPAWIELTRRLPAAQLLPAAAAERIVREAGGAR